MSEGSLHSHVKNEIADSLARHEEVMELELEHPFALAIPSAITQEALGYSMPCRSGELRLACEKAVACMTHTQQGLLFLH